MVLGVWESILSFFSSLDNFLELTKPILLVTVIFKLAK